MSTEYTASQTNYLSWESLTAPNPNGSGKRVHLHPFPSLKVLYDHLDATLEINLGQSTSIFEVNTTAFVEQQYPVNAAQPTKTVKIPHTSDVTNRVIVIWVVVIYSLLLAFSIVLAVGFAVNMHKAKAAEADKTNRVLYDKL